MIGQPERKSSSNSLAADLDFLRLVLGSETSLPWPEKKQSKERGPPKDSKKTVPRLNTTPGFNLLLSYLITV